MILTDGIELYHASYTVVDKIDLSLCAAGKDFDKGFYVTTDYNQACRFIRTAIGKALKNHVKNVDSRTGYVSVFEYKSEKSVNINHDAGSYEADETAIKFLLPENLSDQICFRTEKALKNLSFKDYKTIKLED
ncbi:MAG: DUF3990 domain-containing protein [Treponemataceae bacterium]|nr:DUF3990 domain-containing protein [Treponemataceae bacterium]